MDGSQTVNEEVFEEEEVELDENGLPHVPFGDKLGPPIIVCRHLSKNYSIEGRTDVVRALQDIHLAPNSEFYPIRKGEFVMLRGPSGGGKTTLLNMIGTIDKPTGGNIEILGTSITTASPDSFLADLRLEKIGFVFQTFNLIATMSAFENVELPMTILGRLSTKERRARTRDLLSLVALRDREGHLPSELSGGEQQRVTIARALANEPNILLLDEPTGDLDTKTTIQVMDLLLSINQKLGTTCLMVTHNPDLECYADRILYLSDGRIARQALNVKQSKLEYGKYMDYLNMVDKGGVVPKKKREEEDEEEEERSESRKEGKQKEREEEEEREEVNGLHSSGTNAGTLIAL
eukprot:TRINITY_DN476_c0_g1_i1.p1 TRINITY_DN476_c0_g1~~TRINITY_DN476_c0_g1_i1.p1  ORF type:complete len:349 (-),score=100.30 TRINITY_DN476_c0_g1_i1:31-1077(-)